MVLLTLPFGFNLAIDEMQNQFNILKNGNAVAGLSTACIFCLFVPAYILDTYFQPLGASTSSISVLSHTATAGIINITIMATNLSCPDPQHPAFAAFSMSFPPQHMAITQLNLIRHGSDHPGHSQFFPSRSIASDS
jgi:hypothetical protein